MRVQTHIKRKDLVQVMSGKEKGKTGKVLKILTQSGRATVEKVNMVKRHTKSTGKSPGGILEKEASLHLSNLLLFCEKCNRGVRTGTRRADKGKKVRYCKKCDTQLDK